MLQAAVLESSLAAAAAAAAAAAVECSEDDNFNSSSEDDRPLLSLRASRSAAAAPVPPRRNRRRCRWCFVGALGALLITGLALVVDEATSSAGSSMRLAFKGLGMLLYNRIRTYGVPYLLWREPDRLECPTVSEHHYSPSEWSHYDAVADQCDCARIEPSCPLPPNAAIVRHPRVTFVTALYDLGRRDSDHTLCEYLGHLNRGLLSVHANLVVYTHPALAPTIRRIRKDFGLLNRTVVHAVRREDIPFWSLRSEMQAAMYAKTLQNLRRAWKGGTQEHMIAEYDLIQHAKVDFVADAVEKSAFGSEFYFWVDAGAGKSTHGVFSKHWCPCTGCLRDKVSVLQRKAFNPEAEAGGLAYYAERGWLERHYEEIIGTFWGGGRRAIRKYQALYNSTVKLLLRKGIADDDQPIMEMCYYQQPDLFNRIPGSFFSAKALC